MEEVDRLHDPRFCSYKLEGELRNHVEQLATSDQVEQDTRDRLREVLDEDEANKNTLSYESLTRLHKYLQRADEQYVETPFWLFKEACKCIKPRERANKQLEARLKQLRLRESQLMYDKTARDVDKEIENKLTRSSQVRESSRPGEEFRAFNGSVMAVINSFLVYICTFVFCYKALEYALMEPNIIGQVLFGLFGSTVVAIAELYFLARVI